jgi:hypothetical protein
VRINFLHLIPRRLPDGEIICRDSLISLVAERKWKQVSYDGGSLQYQQYVFVIRWPILLQLQLHINKYGVGDGLYEHVDVIQPKERQFRFQFILKNAARGGELLCEHFIVNRRHFKVFEPCKYRHQVTKVEEGERLLLNLGIRYSFHPIRPCPF